MRENKKMKGELRDCRRSKIYSILDLLNVLMFFIALRKSSKNLIHLKNIMYTSGKCLESMNKRSRKSTEKLKRDYELKLNNIYRR